MRTKFKTSLILLGFLSAAVIPANAAEHDGLLTAARAERATQAAIRQGHWREAQSILDLAQSSKVSPPDQYMLDQLQAYLFYREGRPAAAASAYAGLLDSSFSDPKTRVRRTKTVAQLYFRARHYPQAVKFSDIYLKHRPDDATVVTLVAESDLKVRNPTRAAIRISRLIEHSEARHQEPPESWLRIAQNAYYATGDVQGETRVLTKLVRYYHKPEDWRALLRLSTPDSVSEHVQFAMLRLESDLGLLADANRYEALIFDYLQAGMPAKATLVLRVAEEQHIFSADRAERLHHELEELGLDPQPRLMHVLNMAQRDRTGESDATVGQIYLGEARYGQAVVAFQRSLQKGGLRDADEIRLDLGIALLRDHQPERAVLAFDEVSGRADWSMLAHLWSLRVESAASGLKS